MRVIRVQSFVLIAALLSSSLLNSGFVIFESQEAPIRFCKKRMVLVIHTDNTKPSLEGHSPKKDTPTHDATLRFCPDWVFYLTEVKHPRHHISFFKTVTPYLLLLAEGVAKPILRPPQV